MKEANKTKNTTSQSPEKIPPILPKPTIIRQSEAIINPNQRGLDFSAVGSTKPNIPVKILISPNKLNSSHSSPDLEAPKSDPPPPPTPKPAPSVPPKPKDKKVIPVRKRGDTINEKPSLDEINNSEEHPASSPSPELTNESPSTKETPSEHQPTDVLRGVVRVYFRDFSYMSLICTNFDTTKEVCIKMAKKLKVLRVLQSPTEYFALLELTEKGQEYPISDTVIIWDLIKSWQNDKGVITKKILYVFKQSTKQSLALKIKSMPKLTKKDLKNLPTPTDLLHTSQHEDSVFDAFLADVVSANPSGDYDLDLCFAKYAQNSQDTNQNSS